jgi:hypothetical protein
MSPYIMKIIIIITGSVIAGEALALLIGTRVPSRKGNPWVTPKNNFFIAIDIIFGIGMILIGALTNPVPIALLYSLAIISLIAHGIRDWEYLAQIPNPFCTNASLFIVNNIKIAGLFLIILF